jgi:hypothetical protein
MVQAFQVFNAKLKNFGNLVARSVLKTLNSEVYSTFLDNLKIYSYCSGNDILGVGKLGRLAFEHSSLFPVSVEAAKTDVLCKETRKLYFQKRLCRN